MIYVLDLNFLIDLCRIRGLFDLPRLAGELRMPDGAASNLNGNDARLLHQMPITLCELSGQQMGDVLRLLACHSGLGMADIQSLILARDLEATLLTGAHSLQILARNIGVPTEDVLWVVDQWVQEAVWSPAQALSALEKLLTSGKRVSRETQQVYVQAWGRINAKQI